ncbi:hypothetical protein ACFOW4_19440 [Micromonospora sp. GCM10011542]|uniref:hypothetical protein n=1 Tax=Micromonospora sp. GCM10011542 TaxID=3317337 RepID=UPI0036137EBA
MTNAAHRVLWTVVALLLVACGAVTLAASLGELPGVEPTAALLGTALLDGWRLAAPWSGLAAAVTGALLALAGQRLLDRELRGSARTLRGTLSRPGRRAGRTRMAVDVLARALERDLAAAPGVRLARVVLTGAPPHPDVWIRMDLTADARAADARAHVDAAVRRFAATAGCEPAHLDVTARIAPARP